MCIWKIKLLSLSCTQTSLHMRYLDLSHNEFGEVAGEVLGPAIGEGVAISCPKSH